MNNALFSFNAVNFVMDKNLILPNSITLNN